MANQMMERSLTWAGYDVNHAWGEGGHNQKHASQIFPDVLRWIWKGWPEVKEVKANARGESRWRGYDVVEAEENWTVQPCKIEKQKEPLPVQEFVALKPDIEGNIWISISNRDSVFKLNTADGKTDMLLLDGQDIVNVAVHPQGTLMLAVTPATPKREWKLESLLLSKNGERKTNLLPDSSSSY